LAAISGSTSSYCRVETPRSNPAAVPEKLPVERKPATIRVTRSPSDPDDPSCGSAWICSSTRRSSASGARIWKGIALIVAGALGADEQREFLDKLGELQAQIAAEKEGATP
jgi:hypothetical protein